MIKRDLLWTISGVALFIVVMILFAVATHQIIGNLLPSIFNGNTNAITYKDTIAVIVIYGIIILNKVNRNEGK